MHDHSLLGLFNVERRRWEFIFKNENKTNIN